MREEVWQRGGDHDREPAGGLDSHYAAGTGETEALRRGILWGGWSLVLALSATFQNILCGSQIINGEDCIMDHTDNVIWSIVIVT